jgi:hypothetical protein
MSGVVIRCPHCGTTQATLGECEACHEATTRYFCPNHEPGRWLDGPSCAECGARVGVPGVTKAPPPRPRPTAPSPPPARRTAPPRRTPPRVAAPSPDEWADADAEPWRGPVYSPRDPRMEPGRPDIGDAWRLDPSMLPTAVRVVSVFGCLRRLVMIAFFLLVLFAIAFFGLFGGFVLGSEPVQPPVPLTGAVSRPPVPPQW